MSEKISIKIEYTEGSLFNGWDTADMDTIDQAASAANFGEHLMNWVYDEYPAAEIEITQSDINDRITIENGSDLDHAVVESLVEKVYNEGGWYEYLDADEG